MPFFHFFKEHHQYLQQHTVCSVAAAVALLIIIFIILILSVTFSFLGRGPWFLSRRQHRLVHDDSAGDSFDATNNQRLKLQ